MLSLSVVYIVFVCLSIDNNLYGVVFKISYLVFCLCAYSLQTTGGKKRLGIIYKTVVEYTQMIHTVFV